MKTLPAADAEITFLQLMIAHHQGGVDMAQPVPDSDLAPPVTRLATSIIESHTAEVAAMTELLAARGVQP